MTNFCWSLYLAFRSLYILLFELCLASSPSIAAWLTYFWARLDILPPPYPTTQKHATPPAQGGQQKPLPTERHIAKRELSACSRNINGVTSESTRAYNVRCGFCCTLRVTGRLLLLLSQCAIHAYHQQKNLAFFVCWLVVAWIMRRKEQDWRLSRWDGKWGAF